MKSQIILAVTCALLSHSAIAQELNESKELTPVARPANAPATLGDAIDRVRGHHQARVINLDDNDSSFLIPIAGNTPGSNGTYFRSDVVIANYRSSTQNVAIGWMAAGVDNTHAGLSYYTIPANTVVAMDDFVAATLGKSGLGAVAVFGEDSLGNNDSLASLDGFSRIWTYQPGSSGTVSQNFEAVSLTDSIGSLTAYVVGLRQSSDFRTNVGVVNLDSLTHTWTVSSITTSVKTMLTVPPYSVQQTNVANGSATGGKMSLTLKSDGYGFWWSAYASSVDNRTGDGWVARAKQ